MKSIILLFYVFLSCFLVSAAEQNFYLKNLIEEALINNPKIFALKKDWESKKAKILSEKWLPKPRATAAFFGESVQTKTGPQKAKFGINQKIPFPTKLSLKGRIADKNSEIARVKYILGRKELIRNMKSLFYEYYFVVKSISVLEEEKFILMNMRQVVQRKYEGLEVPQQDLVKADLELSGIEDNIISMRKQENMLQQQLYRLLNSPQKRKIYVPEDYKLEANLIKKEKSYLLEKTLKESPLIQLDGLNVENQEFKWSLAKQEYMPDIGLMADYTVIGNGTTNLANDGNNAWMVGGSLNFPLWFWKISSDIKSEKLKYESEKGKFVDKENFLIFKVEDLYFKLQSNYQLIDLYNNVIVPQSEQNFSTSRISYEENTTDFLNWLDAERNLIRLKIASVRQVVDYMKTVAELEYITGLELENEENNDE